MGVWTSQQRGEHVRVYTVWPVLPTFANTHLQFWHDIRCLQALFFSSCNTDMIVETAPGASEDSMTGEYT